MDFNRMKNAWFQIYCILLVQLSEDRASKNELFLH